MHAMLARWSPKMEVSKMSAFTYAGAHMGTVVSLPLTGLLCDAVGWQFAFYASGSLGVVWFLGELGSPNQTEINRCSMHLPFAL